VFFPSAKNGRAKSTFCRSIFHRFGSNPGGLGRQFARINEIARNVRGVLVQQHEERFQLVLEILQALSYSIHFFCFPFGFHFVFFVSLLACLLISSVCVCGEEDSIEKGVSW
jgi:hypothetical protein